MNSEGEVPLDIAEDDDMINYLQEEVDKQGKNFFDSVRLFNGNFF